MIKIICHRGFWNKKSDQNNLRSCLLGLQSFNGIEIDLRSIQGEIYLSHDPILKKGKLLKLEKLLKLHNNGFYGFNIKEDGLGIELKRLIKKYKLSSYMCFDLSTPERYLYEKLGLKVYDRYGDLDPWNEALALSPGIVVDIFNKKNTEKVLEILQFQKNANELFFISSELHGQNYLKMWTIVKTLAKKKSISICTDCPQKALEFFCTPIH